MRRLIVSLFCFSFMFTVPVVQAETVIQDTATATNLGLYGGEIRYISVDPNSDYIIVGAYSPNGIFISSDNGATWTATPASQNFGEPRGVAINNTGDMYVVASGLFKSTDQGATWAEIGEEAVGDYGGLLLYENSTIVVGRTDGAVSISTDEGATFTTTTLEAGSVAISLAASPTSGTFYAIMDDNTTTTLHKTTDNGVTWSEVTTSDITERLGLVAVDPSDANRLYLTLSDADVAPYSSIDGGATWSALSAVTPFATAISFDSTGRIYMGVDYSDDDGATWAQINATTPISRVSGIVIPDPDNDNTLYAGSFAAFATSTDRGANWTDTNEGITAVSVSDISQSTDKNTVWVATNAGLAKTENFLTTNAAGPTWEFPIYYDSYPESVSVSPTNTNIVVVGGRGMMVKTTDGGDTWTTATGWNSDFTAQQIIRDPATPDTLYAAANYQDAQDVKTGDVFTSTDGGSTWTSLELTGDAPAQAVSLASDGTLYVGIGNLDIRGDGETGIYRYASSTWTKLEGAPEEEVTSILVEPADDTIIYATVADFDTYGADGDTTSGFYRSTDSGVTWTRITAGLEDGTKFRAMGSQASRTPTTLYLSGTHKLTGAGTIYKSTDGGTTWGEYYVGLKNDTFNALLFDGLLGANGLGLYGIQAFTDITVKAKPKSVEKGEKVTLTITLKDAVTGKKLAKRKVVLLRKVGKSGTFKRFKAVTTNKKGVAVVRATIKKNTFFKARFTPKKTIDIEEFTTSTSDTLKVQVKK